MDDIYQKREEIKLSPEECVRSELVARLRDCLMGWVCSATLMSCVLWKRVHVLKAVLYRVG